MKYFNAVIGDKITEELNRGGMKKQYTKEDKK